MATVVNLDWPSKPGLPVNMQKKELIELLDRLKALNINSIFFQVRPECDALYNSRYEPWSYWLTGKQGVPPKPFYDPLKFIIKEAHKRGMELHAWLNPFRAVRKIGMYRISERHIVKTHPQWILTFGNSKILNPGLPEVRKYIEQIVDDLVEHYDLDGIHFDDYFYPYPPNEITNEDYTTFLKYNRGFFNIENWRRDNINLLMKEVYKSIKQKKEFIQFGVSPFGIWRNGIPQGTRGFDAYNRIYSDPITWLKQKTIDYIAPQLYWPFGGKQDFGKLLNWWSAQSSERNCYAGIGYYKVHNWKKEEIQNQIIFTRENANCKGFIFFRAKLLDNSFSPVIKDLRDKVLRYPALPPSMKWLQSLPPSKPENFRIIDSSGFIKFFKWNNPDDSENISYIIYKLENSKITSTDLTFASNILDINNDSFKKFRFCKSEVLKITYFLTAINRYNIESAVSNLAKGTPVILYDKFTVPRKYSLVKVENTLFDDKIDLEFAIPKSGYHIVKMVNSYGSVIAEFSRDELEKGTYKVSIARNSLGSGIYYLIFFSDEDHFVKKVEWLNSN